MVTTIVFVRHGHNKPYSKSESKVPGPSLSNTGIEQAKLTASFLKGVSFSTTYTSSMLRAIETTKIITNHEAHTQDELVEFNKIVFEKYPENIEYFNTNIERALNTKKFFLNILKKHRDSRILIVAHGNTIRYLVASFLKLKPHKAPNFFIDNCSITKLFFDGTNLISVGCINSTTHLFLET